MMEAESRRVPQMLFAIRRQMAPLQRAQEVQDILLLRWTERIEVVDDPIGFRATVGMLTTVLIMTTVPSAAGVRLDSLQ